MVTPLLELACFSLTAVAQAQQLPIQRIELCSSYQEGGLTPSSGILLEVKKANEKKTNVIVRPRSGNFIYSNVEKNAILHDIAHIIELGYHGIVVGALTVNDQPDYAFLETIAEQFAAHTWLTFHRAFDHIPPTNQPDTLIQLQQLDFKGVLTSGLPHTSAIQGATTIAALQAMLHQKKLDIQLIAGGGVHHTHVADLVRQTGVTAIHGAFLERPFTPDFRVDATEVQAVYDTLNNCN